MSSQTFTGVPSIIYAQVIDAQRTALDDVQRTALLFRLNDMLFGGVAVMTRMTLTVEMEMHELRGFGDHRVRHVAGEKKITSEMTMQFEAFRFVNEYGDLARLPLFNQPTYAATPAASAVDTSVVASPPVNTDVDWAIVSALRAQASEQLSQAVASDRSRLDKAAQQELGRSIVLDLIESVMADAVDAGHPAWSLAR